MAFSKTLTALSGLVALSNAHMIMNTPAPFTSPAVSSSPLSADGSNFPCQAASGTSFSGTATEMALGSSQPLAFTGSAVHGGGSCQVSITYDTSPTQNSVWKVIHSIEGGCPAKNTAGNLGNDATMADPYTYTFPIPDNIPTGSATIAWSWLNKVGNREFYMNCAPVTLTGTSGDQANYEALPDMLVANLAVADCTTRESFDYKYYQPGDSVDIFATDASALVFPDGTGCAGYGSNSSSSSGSGSGSSGAASSSAAAVPVSSAVVASSSTLPGGVFITQSTAAASSAAAAETTTSPVAVATPTTTTAAAAATSSAASSSGSGTSSSTAAGSACSSEGEWNCVDGSSYQQCASGTWSVVMPLAAGTSCTIGQSAAINIVASGKRRRVAVRFHS